MQTRGTAITKPIPDPKIDYDIPIAQTLAANPKKLFSKSTIPMPL